MVFFTILAIVLGGFWTYTQNSFVWLSCIGCGVIAAILYLKNAFAQGENDGRQDQPKDPGRVPDCGTVCPHQSAVPRRLDMNCLDCTKPLPDDSEDVICEQCQKDQEHNPEALERNVLAILKLRGCEEPILVTNQIMSLLKEELQKASIQPYFSNECSPYGRGSFIPSHQARDGIAALSGDRRRRGPFEL